MATKRKGKRVNKAAKSRKKVPRKMRGNKRKSLKNKTSSRKRMNRRAGMDLIRRLTGLNIGSDESSDERVRLAEWVYHLMLMIRARAERESEDDEAILDRLQQVLSAVSQELGAGDVLNEIPWSQSEEEIINSNINIDKLRVFVNILNNTMSRMRWNMTLAEEEAAANEARAAAEAERRQRINSGRNLRRRHRRRE